MPTSASKPRLPRKLSLPPPVPCRRQRGCHLLLPPHRSLLAEGASRRESGGPGKAGVRSCSGASQDLSGRGGGGRGGRSRGGAEDSRVLPSASERTRGAKPGQEPDYGSRGGPCGGRGAARQAGRAGGGGGSGGGGRGSGSEERKRRRRRRGGRVAGVPGPAAAAAAAAAPG